MLVPPVIVLLCGAKHMIQLSYIGAFSLERKFHPDNCARVGKVQTDSIGAAAVVHDQPAS